MSYSEISRATDTEIETAKAKREKGNGKTGRERWREGERYEKGWETEDNKRRTEGERELGEGERDEERRKERKEGETEREKVRVCENADGS